MRKTLTIIQVMCMFILLALVFCALGFRDRYGPAFWRAVSGGIQYTAGNVTMGTGKNFTIGSTQWNSSDEIDGTKIKDADYGDVDVSAGGAWTMDSDSVADNEIDYSNVTFADFDYETNWKMWHSNGSGDVTEITLGANGTFLESNGASSAPAYRALAAGDFTSITINQGTDIHLATRTVIKTINLDSSDDDEDFEFDDSQGNTTEQTVDMGAIVPAYAELLSAQLRCFETVAGSGSAVMAIDIGTSDGGAEIFATADIDSAGDISATGAGDGPEIVATAAAKNVWINATPDANWDTLTAGKWSVIVTYIDYGAVHTVKNP